MAESPKPLRLPDPLAHWAIEQLWEAATGNWENDEEMFDSSVAYPGMAIRGKELWRIGVALGLVEDKRG